MKYASFKTSKADTVLITEIVARAVADNRINQENTMDLHMDIAACHCNGTPLKLGELLKAQAFDFNHDINGIQRHINRTTGAIENHFLPRYAQPDKPAAARARVK